MRILLPVHIYLPSHRAGVEQYTQMLAHALGGRGHEVAVVTTRKIISRETGHVERTDVDGQRVWEVVNNLSHDSVEQTWSEPRMEAAFQRVLEDFQPDVVHFQHLMYWSARLPALAKQYGARVLLTLHDFWLMCARMGQLVDPQGSLCHLPSENICAPCMSVTKFGQPPAARKWIERLTRIRSATGLALDEPMRLARRALDRPVASATTDPPSTALGPWKVHYQKRREAFLGLIESVDLFVTPSRSLRNRFVEWGLPEDRIRQVAQGRDHTPFVDSARERRARDGSQGVHFGFLGTLAPHKGVAELIEAFSRVKGRDGREPRLTIHGPYREHALYWKRLNELTAADPRVSLPGPVAPNDVPATLRQFDVSCVPSLWDECCPLTIQEAFLAHLPVLASDLGGLAELVQPGRGGLLAPPGDLAAWTATMQLLVDEPEQLAELRLTIPAVPNIDDHLAELFSLYRS